MSSCNHNKVWLTLFGCNIHCLDCGEWVCIEDLKQCVCIHQEEIEDDTWYIDDTMTLDELKEYIEAQPCEKSCMHCTNERKCDKSMPYCCGFGCKEYSERCTEWTP